MLNLDTVEDLRMVKNLSTIDAMVNLGKVGNHPIVNILEVTNVDGADVDYMISNVKFKSKIKLINV